MRTVAHPKPLMLISSPTDPWLYFLTSAKVDELQIRQTLPWMALGKVFLILKRNINRRQSFFFHTTMSYVGQIARIAETFPWGKLTKDKDHTLRMTKFDSLMAMLRQWNSSPPLELALSRCFNMWETPFLYYLCHLEFSFPLFATKNHFTSYP